MIPRILIVDDEELNLATLRAFLAADGYELHFAKRGSEGCAKARDLQPDMILLDVMMPEMDGFAVCREIRADPVIGRIPILLITALDDDASRLKGIEAGADDFITKPCRRNELRARVRTITSLNRFRTIAEQRTRFEQLYELAPVAIVLADPDGQVIDANPAAKSFLRPPRSAVLTGASLPACFAPEGAETLRREIETALRGFTPEPCEIKFGADSGERILQLRISAVPDRGDRLVLLIFDDVTAERRARDALKKLNTELEDKVRARTQQLQEANTLLLSYASFVSHDLRSPLTVVRGYLGMIEEGLVPINAEAAEMISRAGKAAAMMDEMVVNILQLAREEHEGTAKEHPPAVDPTPVVDRLLTHFRGIAQNSNTTWIVGDLPPVQVSTAVLERVFYNLLANAQKYSAASAAPQIEIGARSSAAGTVLFVRDNGIGFDSREAERLFRNFSRLSTADKTDGLGLGLSLVARLVRSQGGRIWAEGEQGLGATFFVEIPTAPILAKAAAAVV